MKKVISSFLIVLWMLVIFCNSASDGVTSSNYSSGIIVNVVSTINGVDKDSSEMKQIVKKYSFVVRKFAHVFEFFVLGLLVFYWGFNFNIMNFSYMFQFCLCYAISDEIHQLFSVGRSCQIGDVVIDSVASILALVVCYKIIKSKKIPQL